MKKQSGKTVPELVTEQVMEGLKRGKIPWLKPWTGTSAMNFTTKHKYTGINTILASSYCTRYGYKYPLFASFKQIQKAGGTVNKGEHGHIIVFTKTDTRVVDVENENTGEITKEVKKYYMLRYYSNFNLEQTDLPLDKYIKLAEHTPNFTAEELLYRRNPVIKHGGDKACYNMITDEIHLPIPESFTEQNEYYLSAYHELTHWTGCKERLDRDGFTSHDIENYSLEELVAEIGANMLAFESGIEQGVRDNSQAYINGWLKRLQNDPKFVIKASARAQKAYDYCCNSEIVQAGENQLVLI